MQHGSVRGAYIALVQRLRARTTQNTSTNVVGPPSSFAHSAHSTQEHLGRNGKMTSTPLRTSSRWPPPCNSIQLILQLTILFIALLVFVPRAHFLWHSEPMDERPCILGCATLGMFADVGAERLTGGFSHPYAVHSSVRQAAASGLHALLSGPTT